MIRLVIDLDDHPSWVEASKEAVAERLADLGGVHVVEVKVDKPQQTSMGGFRAPAPPPKAQKPTARATRRQAGQCPKCGKEVLEVQCSDGATRWFELEARCYQVQGPDMVLTATGELCRGAFDGKGRGPTGVGHPLHRCKKEVG